MSFDSSSPALASASDPFVGDEDERQPREACGVFGIYAPGEPVAMMTFDGLHALQHRGQESAGLAVAEGSTITVVKDMGLVTDVFDQRVLATLAGNIGIGHTRYSTTGSSTWHNAQPVYRSAGDTQFALGHNGNLTNTAQLSERTGASSGLGSSNDSDILAGLVAKSIEENASSLEDALTEVLADVEGAFSLVFMDTETLIGIRDPNGFRPLCLGRLDNGWVLASESPALDVIGAHFVREINPGEMIIIDSGGVPRSTSPFTEERIDPKLCIFEFVYMARPDAQLYGQEVHGARMRMGATLAQRGAVDADMVMGVPDSGIPAAEGYAAASGIPYGQGLMKNRYIGRTFIQPSQEAREKAVRRKLNPLKGNVAGKRLIVIEDSVVRGTTTRAMVRMLRDAGAREVHLRVTLPPIQWPCFYGIDIGTRRELLAANLTVGEIKEMLDVDSLVYLTMEDLRSAIGVGGAGFCDACMTGNYPTQIAAAPSKDMFEATGVCGVKQSTAPSST